MSNTPTPAPEMNRDKIIIRTSVIGILANVLLAGFKALIGIVSHSIAVLLDAVNNAKTVYFTERWAWDEMVKRNACKDVSWDGSAAKYLALYDELIKG